MDRLRVLTLNIWNRQGPWDERLLLIRAGIQSLSPDLVGLQEVIWFEGGSQADHVAEGLGYHVVFGMAHDLGGGMLFGNAVLSRWPIARSEVQPLPALDTEEHRSVLFTEIDSPYGAMSFFVTHLNWKFHEGYVREKQVVVASNFVKEKAPMTGLPPVIVGDFNAQPDATEIRYLKGLHSIDGKSCYWADSFEQVGVGEGVTFDPIRNPFASVTHEPPRRIDYIFVRGPDARVRGKPLSARVVLEGLTNNVAASDHYGVFAEISTDKAPA